MRTFMILPHMDGPGGAIGGLAPPDWLVDCFDPEKFWVIPFAVHSDAFLAK